MGPRTAADREVVTMRQPTAAVTRPPGPTYLRPLPAPKQPRRPSHFEVHADDDRQLAA